jgi:hypothetical protein
MISPAQFSGESVPAASARVGGPADAGQCAGAGRQRQAANPICVNFGGRVPCPSHVAAGRLSAKNLDEAHAIHAERLALVGKLLKDARGFVEQFFPTRPAAHGRAAGWAQPRSPVAVGCH